MRVSPLLGIGISFALLLTASGHAMTGGQPDFSGQFPSAVFWGSFQCTSVKVAPKFYLTAAHCFGSAAKNEIIDFTSRSTLGRKAALFTQKDGYAPLLRTVFIHPSWTRLIDPKIYAGKQMWQAELSDIALVEVEEDLPIPDAPVSFRPVEASRDVFMGGFGRKIDYVKSPPSLNSATEENSADTTFTFASRPALEFLNEFIVVPSKRSERDVPAYALEGDSGGAAYVQDEAGLMSVVGIISWGTTAQLPEKPESLVDITFLTRLDSGTPKIKDWLCAKVSLPACKD